MGKKPIPPATTVALTVAERKVLEALAGSRRSETRMCDRGPGLYCWRRLARAPVGSRGKLAARRAPCRNGGCAMPITEWRVSGRPAIEVLSRDTARNMDD